MRDKIFVNQVQIRKLLLEGVKPYTIAYMLKIPRSVPDRIFLGKDVPFYYKKPLRDKSNWCTGCGLEPKMDGHMYLGTKCFYGNSDDDDRRGQI